MPDSANLPNSPEVGDRMTARCIPKVRMSVSIHPAAGGRISVAERSETVGIALVERNSRVEYEVHLTIPEAYALATQISRIARKIRERPEGHP